MRKIIYILLPLLLIGLYGCNKGNNYEIKGHVVDNSLNGEYIYLQKLEGSKLVNIDSTLVENSSFTFKGKADSAVIRELNFYPNENRVVTPLVFVLEPTRMTAYIDTVSHVTGTTDNDKLYQFALRQRRNIHDLQRLMEEYQLLSLSGEMTDSLQTAYQGRYDVINQTLNRQAFDFVMLNHNSVAGALVFLQNYSHFTAEQISAILDSAGKTLLDTGGVKIVVAQYEKEKKVSIGMDYIDISLPDTTGVVHSLNDYIGKGKWVLLDFWASWCTPCIQELPFMKDLYAEYSPLGVEFIGISLDKNRKTWVNALRKNRMPWLQLSDLKEWDSSVVESYALYAIPYTILISPDGKIVAKGLRQQALKEEFEAIFSEK